MTTNATTNEDRRWARAEQSAGERELRDEWRAYHLHMADSHDRLAADHRRKARDLTMFEGAGGEGCG